MQKSGLTAVFFLTFSLINAQNTFGEKQKAIQNGVEKTSEIKEVVVTANRKKTFERKIDRFVFNTENSIASKGADGLDVLAATPMVKADDEGNIEIVGKSSVSVMINDKPVNLSGKDLVSYLKTIRSENIGRIEVITTPPAKYEAQGNSGIINIVLKQNTSLGFSGNISTSYQRKSRNGYSNNGSFNYQSKKVNTSLRLSQFNNEKKAQENLSVNADHRLQSESRRLDRNKGYAINYSIDYALNAKTSLGAIFNYSDTRTGNDTQNFSKYYQEAALDSMVISDTYTAGRMKNTQLNMYYEKKLDSLGKKLYVGGNVFGSNNTSPFSLASQSENTGVNYHINSDYQYRIYSGQVDFYLPFKNFTGEIGGKYTRFNTDTGLDFFVNDNGMLQYDENRSNTFAYHENNWASYMTVSKKISDQWEGKAGLRYEYTSLNGISRDAMGVKNEYGKWFPSVYAAYKPDMKHIFTLSYSKRITRPDGRALNPSTIYINPYSYVTGNPYLKPSFSNNFELGYVFKSKFSMTAYYQSSKDNFGQIVGLKGAANTVNYLNNYDETAIGINTTFSGTYFKRWDVYASANYAYVKSKGLAEQVQGLSSHSLYYSINNTIHLNAGKTFSLLLNFWNFLPHTKGNFEFQNTSNLSSGLRMAFMDKKLQINMTVQDIFKGMKFRGKAYYSSYSTYSNNYYDARTFTISATYQFGNNKVKGNSKQIKLEEADRAN